jgi:hypothetical protein
LEGFVSYEAAVSLALVMAFAGPLALQAAQMSRQTRQIEARATLVAAAERVCRLASMGLDPRLLTAPDLKTPEGMGVEIGRESVIMNELPVPGLQRLTCRARDLDGREVALVAFAITALETDNRRTADLRPSQGDGSLPGEAQQ